MADIKYTADNAAEAILDHAVKVAEYVQATTGLEPGYTPINKDLILHDVWDRLTTLLKLGPGDLRRTADEMEEEAE